MVLPRPVYTHRDFILYFDHGDWVWESTDDPYISARLSLDELRALMDVIEKILSNPSKLSAASGDPGYLIDFIVPGSDETFRPLVMSPFERETPSNPL